MRDNDRLTALKRKPNPDSKCGERHVHRDRTPVEVVKYCKNKISTTTISTNMTPLSYPFLNPCSSSNIPPGPFSATRNKTTNLFL